ncbi:pfs, ankyrin repeats & 6-phosphofructo-2-kinase [Ophiocordyceps sinensis CO18]|uniref:Pfs, ankyrin repeats & 6-phosphofructo-2-kinase n=1 Tax=Ophiocordyceps sinensis (strain Co18 / CGMCC 3.14243) TaxID=911162 RepID=T5AMY5_OPHSC|nr:pfs, ankyrin repeats & 6-phosphofructo-2-kinase [Ophiocordyceps sinensis CO18]
MSILPSHIALYALALAPAFRPAAAAGDDLSDFSNNLAQDLGPLLALFGEPVTRQYLSESTTFLDYFIFAMCPLGIITAVTAVVRVCGHSSLRAFIGRSQEGNGVVEAELCTSTSRDVCELFNNGGITRVLGQPNVLELVCIFPGTSPINATDEEGPKLFLFQDYIGRTDEGLSEWKKLRRSLITSSDSGRDSSNLFAPKPNLSLNVGIKRQPSWVFILVALTGLVLQVGIIVLAGFGAWGLGWNLYNPANPSSKDYAPRMFISGTALLCIGMCSCAAIVGQATQEVTYKRRRTCSEQHSMLLWLQPGPQVVGDQSFDPFSHFENPSKPLDYWISSRKRKTGKTFELLTLVAMTFTIMGYVLQFIGLRGMKAWVSIAQLATTLFMSFLRGLLRMRRFGEGDNALAKMPDLVPGHELDWMAFEIARKGSPVKRSPPILGTYRRVFDFFTSRLGRFPRYTDDDFRLHRTPPSSRNAPCWHITGQHAAAQAHSVKRSDSSSRSDDEVSVVIETMERPLAGTWESRNAPNDHTSLLSMRARLAHLTGHFTFENMADSEFQDWRDSLVQVRARAKLLASAVEKAAKVMLQTWDRRKGKPPESILLKIKASNGIGESRSCEEVVHVAMKFVARSHWKVDSSQIEALLGLWIWSLLNDRRLTYADETENMRSSAEKRVESMQIISALDEDSERQTDAQDELNLWLGSDGPAVSQFVLRVDNDKSCGCADLWTSDPAERGVWQKLGGSLSNTHSVTRRFFGWNVVYESLGFSPFETLGQSRMVSRRNGPSGGGVRTKIHATPRIGSLLDVCATEVYSALVCSLMSLEGLDMTTIESTLLEHDGYIQLENRSITGLAKAFVDSGLGTRSDVLLSIVPALRNQVHPSSHAMLAGLVTGVDVYRRNGEWDRAQLLMRWAFRQNFTSRGDASNAFEVQGQPYASPLAYILQRTGELYRWSLAEGTNKERILFGIAGVEWMSQFLSKDPTGGSRFRDEGGARDARLDDKTQAADEVIERYKEVAERIEQGFASTEPQQTVAETHPLIQALEGRDRTGTLLHLCLVKVGAFGAKALQPAFPLAERNNWTEVADAILELKGSLDSQDDEGRTAASHCAETGLGCALERLIQRGAFLDQADRKGRTPLHWAAQAGHVSIVQMLMASGQVDSDRQDSQGTTPLWDALYQGHLSVVEELLAAGIDIESRQKDGQTPLTWAAQKGHLEMMKKLLDHGADVHQKGDRERTAIHWASAGGHTPCLQLLLEHGSSMYESDRNYYTPITLAAENGHEGCIDALILHGADINWGLDESSRRPLQVAAGRGHCHVLRKLIQSGADVNWHTTSGYGALIEASSHSRLDAVKVLLDNGARINDTDNGKRTSLHWAIEKSTWHSGVVELLLERGIEVNSTNSSGDTALHLAASLNYEDSVEALLKHDGIQVNKANDWGKTPLLQAAERCHKDVVQMLLDHEADVNVADHRGRTPLMYAAERTTDNDGAVAKLLLDNGADVNRVSSLGRTALTYAYKSYNDDIAQMLLDRGAKGMEPTVDHERTKGSE